MRQTQKNETKTVTYVICPKCNAANQKGSKVCTDCGERL